MVNPDRPVLAARRQPLDRARLSGLARRAVASDLARNIAETYATKILILLLSFVTSVLIARTLGPDGRGRLALAAVTVALATQASSLGLPSFNTYKAAQQPSLMPTLLGNSLVVSGLTGSVAAAVVVGLTGLRPDVVELSGTALVLVLLTIPATVLLVLTQSLLSGLYRIRTNNRIELTTQALSAASVWALYVGGAVSVEMLLASNLLWTMVALGRGLAALGQPSPVWPTPQLRVLWQARGFAAKSYLANFLMMMVLKVDLLMVSAYRGTTETGYYSLAVSLGEMICLLPTVAGGVLFAKLSALGNWQHKLRLTMVVAATMAMTVGCVAVLAFLFAEPFIGRVYGEAFLPSASALRWLLPGIFALSINSVLMNLFGSTGMPLVTVISPAVAAALNVVLNLRLIPLYGDDGAAIASSICYGLMLTISCAYLAFAGRRSR